MSQITVKAKVPGYDGLKFRRRGEVFLADEELVKWKSGDKDRTSTWMIPVEGGSSAVAEVAPAKKKPGRKPKDEKVI